MTDPQTPETEPTDELDEGALDQVSGGAAVFNASVTSANIV